MCKLWGKDRQKEKMYRTIVVKIMEGRHYTTKAAQSNFTAKCSNQVLASQTILTVLNLPVTSAS